MTTSTKHAPGTSSRRLMALCSLIPAALVLLPLQSQPAEAHIISTRFGDFYSGVLHPLTDLTDCLIWLALGALAGSLGADRSRWLVVLFPLGLFAGLASASIVGTWASNGVTTATVITGLGLLIAAGLRLPTLLLGLIGFAVAVLRGIANASGLEGETNVALFGAGVICAGYVMMTLLMALVVVIRRTDLGERTAWRGIAVRAIGGWIAAIGIMLATFSWHGALVP